MPIKGGRQFDNCTKDDQQRYIMMFANLRLTIMWMMHWMWIETLKLLRRKQNNALVATDLCIEILLFIVVAWSYITCTPASQHVRIAECKMKAIMLSCSDSDVSVAVSNVLQ